MPSRVQSLVHVALHRYIDLFIPSLQWIPWPPPARALRFSTFIGTSDPGDPDHTSHTSVPDTAFRTENDVSIAIRPISGLNHRDLLTHCVRFAPAIHPTNGNT